jgi:hypothetical protein
MMMLSAACFSRVQAATWSVSSAVSYQLFESAAVLLLRLWHCSSGPAQAVFPLISDAWMSLQIVVSSFEETLPHHWFENAADYAVETARHKALDVAKVCAAAQNGKPPVDLIISADTVSADLLCTQ